MRLGNIIEYILNDLYKIGGFWMAAEGRKVCERPKIFRLKMMNKQNILFMVMFVVDYLSSFRTAGF
ncbi:MAG: hypothetical protein EBU66_18370 [Bacteroidetes bacterium]|nr:hypothetical protein [Bacteroidota bacterium]